MVFRSTYTRLIYFVSVALGIDCGYRWWGVVVLREEVSEPRDPMVSGKNLRRAERQGLFVVPRVVRWRC